MTSTEADHQRRLAGIAAELEARARGFERREDSRCVFAWAYVAITKRLAEALPHTQLSDREWVVQLAEAFSKRYLDALDAADAGRDPGEAWATVFERLGRKRTSVLEDLVTCMLTHLVHDLPLALCDVGVQAGDGTSHIADFHAVNDILATSVGAIQEQVARRYNPYLRWLDYLGADFDEVLTNYGFRLTRAAAWYNALRVLDPASSTRASEAVTHSPKVFLDSLLNPPVLSLRIVVRLIRVLTTFGRRWPSEDT